MVMPRKAQHIEICLNENVDSDIDYWDDITFIHDALPELDMDEIDTSIQLFGKKLEAPLVISAITGGFEGAEKINRNLAIGAGKAGIGLGVGSQRAAIEEPGQARTYEVVKEHNVPLLIANLGAPQLIRQGDKEAFGIAECQSAIDMIDADILAIHLNFAQEIGQIEGDAKARGCLDAIENIAAQIPVIAKETGAGLSDSVASRLKDAGVRGFDIGGMSGTSFSAVEYHRSKKDGHKRLERMGQTFWNWGIPTPVSLVMANVGLPMIATGGVKNGLDVARSVAMGASAAGMAKQVLAAAMENGDAVEKELNLIISELKGAMLLTGCRTVEELANAQKIIMGRTAIWLEQTGGMR